MSGERKRAAALSCENRAAPQLYKSLQLYAHSVGHPHVVLAARHSKTIATEPAHKAPAAANGWREAYCAVSQSLDLDHEDLRGERRTGVSFDHSDDTVDLVIGNDNFQPNKWHGIDDVR